MRDGEYGSEVAESLLREFPASTDSSISGYVDFNEFSVDETLDSEGLASRDSLNRGLVDRGIAPAYGTGFRPRWINFGSLMEGSRDELGLQRRIVSVDFLIVDCSAVLAGGDW